jgi:outer membrane protein TolC
MSDLLLHPAFGNHRKSAISGAGRTKMKLYKIVSLTSIIAISATVSAFAQKKILTLDEAVQIALDKSFSTKSLGLRLQSAGFGLNAARGRFRTNARLDLLVPSFQESVREIEQPDDLPVYRTTGTTTVQSLLTVIQPLPSDGEIFLRSRFYHRDRSLFIDDDYQSGKEFYSSLSLNFRQPFFTLNRLQADLEKAHLNYEQTERALQRTQLDIVFEVTDSFYELYRATRSVQIAGEQVKQLKNSYELALKKYEAGLIPEVEALQMEVDYAQSQNDLLTTEGFLVRQEDWFKQLIGMDLSENITVETRFDYQPFQIDETFAVQQALENRSEIRERQIQERLEEINVKDVDSRVDFRMEVNAFYDITGVSEPGIVNTDVRNLIESSFSDISRRPKNKGVVVTMAVPLWDWGVNKNEVREAQSRLDEATLSLEEQKKSVRRDVRSVISRVKETMGRLTVLEKSEEIAQKSYDISLARFENGDITSQELALDRDRLTAAKTDYLDAYIQYKLALADLRRKTLWDFETGESLSQDR